MTRFKFAVAAAITFALVGCTQGEQAPKKNPNAVKLDFYVMSQCPYGVQVVDGVKEALDALGPDVDFTMNFIGDEKDGKLTAMHGENEVAGNKVQLCAAKYAPATYREMIACQNKNYREVATNWEKCATDAKLPVEKIRACFTGQEGIDLLKASYAASKAANASGSPTIKLAGKPYNGARTSMAFRRALCAEFKPEALPEACKNIPEPPKVTVRILNDKRCTDCNADRYTPMIKSRLLNADIKTIDFSDPEGQKLWEEVGATGALPMIVFDETLDADKDGLQMLQRSLRPAGKLRSFEVGSKWNPVCADATACAKDECKNTLACRAEVKGKLELFLMSQCPYGLKAYNAMPEVLKAFGKEMNFQVHFIGGGDAEKGLTAMHGQSEVDENIRELCAMKLYPKNHKYMDYILCRNQNIRAVDKWADCATKATGIDAAAMQKCFDTEGKKLLEADYKVASALGIGASPSWMVNGKTQFSALDAPTIQKTFCQHNPGLKGCSVTLAAPAPDSPAGKAAAAPQGSCGN